jgi:hypothetical protein
MGYHPSSGYDNPQISYLETASDRSRGGQLFLLPPLNKYIILVYPLLVQSIILKIGMIYIFALRSDSCCYVVAQVTDRMIWV